jgi:ethanolamine utilization protein EutQ (cupin superfamily)
MSENTLTQNESKFLDEKPGIQLIKAGSYDLKELSKLRGTPELKGQIIDAPITDKKEVLTMGFFALQPSVDYTAEFDFIEIKVVTKGKMVVRDVEGNKYVGEVGDVLIFSPKTTVIFDGESDGEAVYFKNVAANPSYL